MISNYALQNAYQKACRHKTLKVKSEDMKRLLEEIAESRGITLYDSREPKDWGGFMEILSFLKKY